MQNERSACLAASWVYNCTHRAMEEGQVVQVKWVPKLEANPFKGAEDPEKERRRAEAKVDAEKGMNAEWDAWSQRTDGNMITENEYGQLMLEEWKQGREFGKSNSIEGVSQKCWCFASTSSSLC